MACRAVRSETATARTATGRDPTSSRACSRNCLASETSSGTITRPPRGVTPMAYSLAASEAAATMRRETENRTIALANPPDGTHELDQKPTQGLTQHVVD